MPFALKASLNAFLSTLPLNINFSRKSQERNFHIYLSQHKWVITKHLDDHPLLASDLSVVSSSLLQTLRKSDLAKCQEWTQGISFQRINTINFFLNVCKPKSLVSPAQWFWWLRIQFPQWNLNNNISARQHRFVGCQLRNKRRTQHHSLTLDSIIIIIIIITIVIIIIIIIPTFDSVDTIDEGLHVVVALFLAWDQEIQLYFKSGQQLQLYC